MKQCPACKRELKDHLLYCPFDGQLLITATKRDNFLGTILDDKYRLDEKIGEGGMGKVYKATHIHMDYTVAAKILHAHLASDDTALERFRREARAAAHIRHPNAVAVTDFGVTKDTGIAYLIMELLEGLELREKIKQLKQLDYEESLVIVQQTCSALQAAHAKGIIHRDLKPDNIWLLKTEEGIDRVKVLDFGIAKLKTASPETSKLTQQGMIVGTPHYMSPEQCRGDELDARSDIYSLGVILYEMLTGQVPFQASTPIGVVLKHANEPPPPPREFRAEIPEPVEGVILRALNKKREDRQDSAVQLAQEFERALYDAGIELKMLGTKTPQSFFSLSTFPPAGLSTGANARATGTSKSIDTSEVSRPPAQVSTKSGDSMAAPVPAPGQATLDLFQRQGAVRTSPGVLGQRKLLVASLAAAAVIGLIVGIILLTRSRPVVTPGDANMNANTTGTGTKTATLIPPDGMVYVRGGTFVMGNNSSNDKAETPEHSVQVNDFFLDKYEVSNKDYYEFIQSNPNYPPPKSWDGGKFPPERATHPVTDITWNEAKAYAQSRGKRLPTEIEWEYAARGTDKRLYPWSSEWDPTKTNTKESGTQAPLARGSAPADKSPFAVEDMAGNVSEWTDSTYEPYPNSNVPLKDSDRNKKVVRGGNYVLDKEYARVTKRLLAPPDARRSFVGFRCAQDIPR